MTKQEVKLIADFLKTDVAQLRRKYLRGVGFRTSIIEEPVSKDCIFLKEGRCGIYQVRPTQCRSWPFWTSNLGNAGEWNEAARMCPGINKGRLFSYAEIENIKRRKQWW